MSSIYPCGKTTLLYFFGFLAIGRAAYNLGNIDDIHEVNVGTELYKETLPLHNGYRLYRLRGLKASTWYEVKISYPASIPCSFSIQLKKERSELGLNRLRRLLNTEKLIFKVYDQSEIYVLVSVEPAGVVALPNVQEREFVIFNIVCDELILGIPHKAWWVGFLALLCLGIALLVPKFLPPYLLPKNQSLQEARVVTNSKAS